MSLLNLLLLILVVAALGYFIGRSRALKSAKGDQAALHSRPHHYGWNVAIFASLPALLVMVAFVLLQALVVPNSVLKEISPELIESTGSRSLVMTQVQTISNGLEAAVENGLIAEENIATLDVQTADVRALIQEAGVVLGADVNAEMLESAKTLKDRVKKWSFIRNILIVVISLAGLIYAIIRTNKDFRARNVVENSIIALLVAAASIAIFTTIGIVLSMTFETLRFFELYPASQYFFGTQWAANFRGGSALGVLPLLWGTLYISLIALAVAVPIGLFAAIYLSEYASPLMRSVAKPTLEVLAGIPTIVYGLFALTTFGPFLLGLFGKGGALGVEWMADGRSVLTAGIVMGIMLIPFVSSLSDDIINSVPQAMRDGSYGLGATQSETVRQVILPAALPGVVGAILLAASRAIGETMIVVMGAGATAAIFYESPDRFINPFEIMTTITTRIVAQLTGDGAFNSPETLVAFALGLTLFCLTLMLNVYALYIVRKYQERYV